MRLLSTAISLLTFVFFLSCRNPAAKEIPDKGLSITFAENLADKRIDVLVDGTLFTAYRWPADVYKPILYPLMSAAGHAITRGFPLEPREGERNDHRHQVGNWLNYGHVNGYDFWGNGHEGKREPNGGEIKHLRVEKLSPGSGEALMIVHARWVDPSGKALLAEKTEYHFIARDSIRIIDRIETLTASAATPVNFKDTKEGMFGIRVARQLELPSEEAIVLIDAQGNPATAEKISNDGVTGNYRSSEGITGNEVWGTRAKWMDLYGTIENENISLVICDHPENEGYPTYWHARGYGLFAANPFGAKDFTKGKEELNYTLPPGQSLIFRYRILMSSGKHLTDEEINAYASDFAKKY